MKSDIKKLKKEIEKYINTFDKYIGKPYIFRKDCSKDNSISERIGTIIITIFKNAGLSKEATLKDIYDYSKIVLHIYAVNSATFTLEEFTHITNPDMKVLDVVYMSCSIPFIFQPLYIEKCYYIDAGVINPYPLDLCLKQHDKEEILGFKIVDDKFNTCCEKTSIFYFGFY